MLTLQDVFGYTNDQIISHIVSTYETEIELVKIFDILIAYESVGDYGCDSASFFLLEERVTGDLYENHGSHCSCYGFEYQFKPEITTIEYLKSEKFSFTTGGYDDNVSENELKVNKYIKNMIRKIHFEDQLFTIN